jgi:hypothetical protein
MICGVGSGLISKDTLNRRSSICRPFFVLTSQLPMKAKACLLERYFKSGSGKAFAKKRFLSA